MARNTDRAQSGDRRGFWVPFWIFLVIAAACAAYFVGWHVTKGSSNDKELTAWALAATRNPLDGIQEGDKLFRSGKIDFGTYRELIHAALKKRDSDAVQAAFDSMVGVLSSGFANQRDLAKEIRLMQPIALLSIPGEDDKTKGLAEEIRASGFEVVLVGKNNGSRQTSVVCYNADTCKLANDLVTPLLVRRGFQIEKATQVNRDIPAIDTGEASAAGKGASVSAFEKRIDILLGAPATAPAAEKSKKGKNKNS